jgi:hypothetical protein
MLTNLIIQIVAGALGGNALGSLLKNVNLGTAGNMIAGAVGGGLGGQFLQAVIPALASAAGGGVDIGSLIGNAVGGGATGAIATLLVGLVKNMMSGHQTR